ncbi:MAG: Fpg/Nei family DNA glycosylase [Thermoleophilaceae bacterium]
MPEGDTVHHAARTVGAALVGKRIVSIEMPQPRHALDGYPRRLEGVSVRAVDARGKHLFVRFEGGWTLHSHLRMSGSWRVYLRGERWRRAMRRAWLVIRTEEHDVVQFDGPVLELMRDGRTRFDRTLAALGPDMLDPQFDGAEYLRRLRADDPTRGIGDALLDQRNLAGIGNVWKSEGCFLAGIDPWRSLGRTSDAEAHAIVAGIRPLMERSAERGGRITTFEASEGRLLRERPTWVYGRAERPCRRCGTLIRARGQGEDNRTTFWCSTCQR